MEGICFVIQSAASGRVRVTGARYTPESEPVAAFGDDSFPTVTQPDNASARYAAMIKFFTATVSALFPVDGR
jgi:hypothetical protein